MDRPDIVGVIERYSGPLRKSGKEYTGLCPFHDDKSPSLSANQEKGVFHCFACGAGGDVFDFVMKIEGVTFAQATKSLGVGSGCSLSKPKPDLAKQRAAAALATWLNDQHLKLGVLLRKLSREIALAEKIPDRRLVGSLTQQWEILSALFDDLQNPTYAEELFRAKDFIESITILAEPEPLPTFPEPTPQYREYLLTVAKGEPC